ncbi:DUF1129 family protein [Pseudobacillus sp. 179-B 2D1 NHS]|uniref:DUF1129 family protein n=1 Tax=Pseudobacillus sp. 179-B 2D1 NHS TaxID=3374292 RepID=UPI0038790EFF
MNAKEMVNVNNERRRCLSEENEKYYSDMLVYIRTSRIAEKAGEELLLELLEHLIEAQTQGKTAEDVFGKHPKDYCERLITGLPKPGWKERISFYLYISFLGAAWLLITDGIMNILLRTMNIQTKTMTLLPVMISFIGIAAIVMFIVRGVKWTVYAKRPVMIAGLIGVCVTLLVVSLAFLNSVEWFGVSLSAPLSPFVTLAAAVISFLISFYFKKLDQQLSS